MAYKETKSKEEVYDIRLGRWGSLFGPYGPSPQPEYYIDEGYIEFYEKEGYIWVHHPTHHEHNYGVRVEIIPPRHDGDPKVLRFTIRQRSNGLSNDPHSTAVYCTYEGPIDPTEKVVKRGKYTFSTSAGGRRPPGRPPDGDWVPPVPPPSPRGDDGQ